MEAVNRYDLNGIFFELPERYTPIKMIGRGTYGAVINANDAKTGNKVAIKKLSKIEDAVDAKRVLREILIMKNLEHENVLGLLDVVYVPHQTEVLGDIYLVTELLETDLNRVIKSKQKLTDEHI